ncbi:hypothetical protein [Nitrococcus mobilis]|uniref:Uncharacterized protein n=1 Tax=Nitrococcus mobilis Nb-231 TaxID=314278 RepID=A4BV21_9GAMM|nr:hypothetical protein [Nitrococcus mobilis]EAR20442.1 hypothetical protein NB231_13976 [Nitrococcus mobilis Nb-231]
METPERPGPALPLSGVVVLLALLSAALYQHAPLKGSRPAAPREKTELVVHSAEDVPARLWQDPFAAVALYKGRDAEQATDQYLESFAQAQRGPRHTFEALRSQINTYLDQAGSGGKEKKLIVMGVMVFGGPYAEYREWRLRSRYAVISALGRAGYGPDDSEHIGYFEPDEAINNAKENAKQPLPRRIPYEWFSPIQSQNTESQPPLLLLWLDDDAFHDEPLTKLSELLELVREGRTNLQFKILGPAGSTTLQAMAQELNQSKGSALSNEVEIYSPSATVADEFLPKPRNEVTGTHLLRTIATDKDLAEALICELRRRGVNAVCNSGENRCRNQLARICEQNKKGLQFSPHKGIHTDHIALIAEWDSFYGRSLPEAFTGVVRDWHCGLSKGNADNEEACRLAEPPNWIHRFSYLRGIDGQLPGMPEKAGQNARRVTEKTENAERIERPEGRGQFDYLHRLSQSLYALQAELAAKEQTLQAIGVLGSDVYDKLLLLQALKKRFPRAIFFTTDLDARLAHPAEYEWTRNLIVASGFGLKLSPALQGDIPPFRDGYQTSLFYAASQLALDPPTSIQTRNITQRPEERLQQHPQPTDRPPDPKTIVELIAHSPRIFEIGRSGPIDLTVPNDNNFSIHPSRRRPFPAVGWYLAVPVLLLGLLYLASESVAQAMHALVREIRSHPVLVLTPVLLVVLFALAVGYPLYSNRYAEEPLLWLEGVSIWPTELLRGLASVLSLVFFWKAKHDIDIDNDRVARQFSLSRRPAKNLVRELGMVSTLALHRWGRNSGAQRSVDLLWQEYLALGSCRNRIKRTLLYGVLFMLLGSLLIRTFGPPGRPYRGEISDLVDQGMLIISVGMMVALVFFVVDATRLAVRFIRQLADENQPWQREIIERPSQPHRVEETYLGPSLKIKLIAERTGVIGQLIVFPFIVLSIMILSRLPYFDNWNMPIGLVLVLTLLFVFAATCGIALERAAEKARSWAIERLTDECVRVKGDPSVPGQHAEQLHLLVEEIRHLRKGAFVPFIQQPVVKAVLLPFGGVGGVVLIQYLVAVLG